MIWWNDVDTVGPDYQTIRDFEDLQAGIALDQFGKDAMVIRSKMLHQHKGHTRFFIGGHTGKEGFKSGKTTSGSADADDGEVVLDACFSGNHFLFRCNCFR